MRDGLRPMTVTIGRNAIDAETLAIGVILLAVLLIGLVTFPDYGVTNDEFIFDKSGPSVLRWYASGFTETPSFPEPDMKLYGPWFQILVTGVQSLGIAPPMPSRHLTGFIVGL